MVLGAAYLFNLQAYALTAYTGWPTAGGQRPPALIWSKSLGLDPGEHIVSVTAAPDRILVVTAGNGHPFRIRWLDWSGNERAVAEIEEVPPVWTPVEATVVTGMPIGDPARWQLQLYASQQPATLEEPGYKAAGLRLVPAGPGQVAVVAFGDHDPPAGPVSDHLVLYSTSGGDAVDPGWARLWSVTYEDESIVDVQAGNGFLAVTVFRGDFSHPYRLELRDLEGNKVWEQSLEAPGWLVSHIGALSLAGSDRRAPVILGRRTAEVAVLGARGAGWIVPLDDPVDVCWPLGPSLSSVGCLTQARDDGNRRLATINDDGRLAGEIALPAEASVWPLDPYGLVVSTGSGWQVFGPAGRELWSWEAPFTARHVAMYGDVMILAGDDLLALAEVQPPE